MPKVIIYDCEIINCVPHYKEQNDPNYKYCKGWSDYEGMGIAVIGTYNFEDASYQIFLKDNFADFQALVDSSDIVVGFNSISFDDALVRAHGLTVKTHYDILCEVREASGQPRNFTRGVTRGGYTLGEIANSTFAQNKLEKGANAPKLWQDGHYGRVINYCIDDVRLCRKVLMAGTMGNIIDPTNGQKLTLPDARDVYRSLSARAPQGEINFE